MEALAGGESGLCRSVMVQWIMGGESLVASPTQEKGTLGWVGTKGAADCAIPGPFSLQMRVWVCTGCFHPLQCLSPTNDGHSAGRALRPTGILP